MPSLFGVEEVEGDDVEAECGQRAGELDHPRTALTRAGAVRQNQRGADRRHRSAG